MSIYAKGSFSGDYVAHGDSDSADVVIGHAFGIRKDSPGTVNEALAGFIDDRYSHLPILPNRDIARALHTKPEFVLDGDPSNTTGHSGLGTWGELQQATTFMHQEGLKTAILVGQAFHIGRIDRQAQMFAMDTVIPEHLPNFFDPESLQWWTRHRSLWIARESLGALVLRHQGKL
ncbi:MAG: hypothetical protein ACHQTE_00535 [Candidatus Saccharimonadales bacterium]